MFWECVYLACVWECVFRACGCVGVWGFAGLGRAGIWGDQLRIGVDSGGRVCAGCVGGVVLRVVGCGDVVMMLVVLEVLASLGAIRWRGVKHLLPDVVGREEAPFTISKPPPIPESCDG